VDEALRKKVTELAQLDRDAVGVYDDALEHVEDAQVREHFKEFRDEHDNHVAVIEEALERLVGVAPDLNVDFMGRMAEFVTSIRSASGTTGALHAMRTAEHYHNRRYEEAAGWNVGDVELAGAIERFRGEEKRHLAYVEGRLEPREAAQ
jgi:rubrerythrin